MSERSGRRRKLGLAFGGGAARGIAHLGVIKVLDEAGIRADFVSGTSVGSIVGALYAGGFSWETVVEVVRALDWGDLVQPVLPRVGLVRADRLEERLVELLGDLEVQDLDTPFAAVTVDLISGEQHVIQSGRLSTAVRASCSVPGIFEPVNQEGRVLVDGGILNDVPIDVCQSMGAEVVMGIDVNSDAIAGDAPDNIFAVLTASFNVMVRSRQQSLQDDVDVVIVRPDLAGFSYHNLKRVDEMIQRGEDVARQAMPRLLGRLKPRFLRM